MLGGQGIAMLVTENFLAGSDNLPVGSIGGGKADGRPTTEPRQWS